MPMTVEQLTAEAMTLPLKVRAELADRLVVSLGDEMDPEIEKLWAQESNRRFDSALGIEPFFVLSKTTTESAGQARTVLLMVLHGRNHQAPKLPFLYRDLLRWSRAQSPPLHR